MDFRFFILLFVIAIGIVCPTSGHAVNHKSDDELIFSHTVCRHGDRNRYENYLNDRWKDRAYWPEGYAHLTKVGMQQHYELGQFLRKRYAKLLGNGEYNTDKVYVYSTDTDRTLMSAESCLASLFAPNSNQVFNPNLPNWQPIPVHTKPRNEETVVAPEKPCARYELEMIKFTHSNTYKTLLAENHELMDNLGRRARVPMKSLTSINYLWDTLYIEKLKGKSMDLWALEALVNKKFKYLAEFYFAMYTQTTLMKTLRMGYLLKEILDRSENKTMSSLNPDRSLWMYFAHDNTIVDLLNGLGVYELHAPPYASCLFFELYKPKDSTDSYLQLFYRNSTHDNNIPAIEIPNCGVKCPLSKWFTLYKKILPTRSYEDECATYLPVNPKDNPEHFSI